MKQTEFNKKKIHDGFLVISDDNNRVYMVTLEEDNKTIKCAYELKGLHPFSVSDVNEAEKTVTMTVRMETDAFDRFIDGLYSEER